MARLVKKQKGIQAEEDGFLPNARKIAELAAEKKARDIKAFDVRELTLVADSFIYCTATSEPQLKAIYNSVLDGMKKIGVRPLRSEGGFGDGWVLMDYGTVIFHIFREKARVFYDLDGLWGDAPEIALDLE